MASDHGISFIICIFIVIISTQTLPKSSAFEPQYVDSYCEGRGSNANYTSNSFYQRNLNSLLTNLASLSSANSFSNTTAGSTTSSDVVYGLFLCRGDVSSQDCHTCIQDAAQSITSICPVQKEAMIWYQECILRYANRMIFALEDESVIGWSYSDDNATTSIAQTVSTTLDKLFNEAAYGGYLDPKFFATGEADLSGSETLYCLVQCTPDIRDQECMRCLNTVKRDLGAALERVWASGVKPSCLVMYNTTLFYNMTWKNQTPNQTHFIHGGDGKNVPKLAIPIAVVAGVLLLLAVGGFLWYCLRKRKANLLKKRSNEAGERRASDHDLQESDIPVGITSSECVQFSFKTIEEATRKFSLANKLGEGGFGIVYQGTLQKGEVVAVKRLSKQSRQGIKEFKNEVVMVASLQHKNLVKLLGFCEEGDERLLVYEFMANLSLDRVLFDQTKSSSLDWRTRYKIIKGIARGLKYLHEDSRLTIIHRDLKTSNILLDEAMGPKIADFGMARLVQIDETSGNTTKIVGTYGYMAPEYAMSGRFSVLSDVYSFGVMLLEIVSGKSNSQFYNSTYGEGLLCHAWRKWNEGSIEELIDPVLQRNYSRMEAQRCTQIGLLCVQDDATIRPTMHLVNLMLNSNANLESPVSPSKLNRSPHRPPTGQNVGGVQIKHTKTASQDSYSAWDSGKDMYPR